VLDIVRCWSKTQSKTLREQCEGGARYLDIRLSLDTGWGGEFGMYGAIRLVHGLYNKGTFKAALIEVAAFLDAQPGEMLILDANHLYNFKPDEWPTEWTEASNGHQIFLSLVREVLACKMVPQARFRDPIESLLGDGYQVFVLYEEADIARQNPKELLTPDCIVSPWPDVMSPWELQAKLRASVRDRGAKPDTIHVTQGIVTPRAEHIVRGVVTGACCFLTTPCCLPAPAGLRSAAHRNPNTNHFVKQWLDTYPFAEPLGQDGAVRTNVLISDFLAEDAPLVDTVIALNTRHPARAAGGRRRALRTTD